MDIEKVFEDIGFSGHQVRALLALIQCGEAKASDIAQLSGIPRAKVYSVLDQLVDLGLVDKKPGRPIMYKAKRPKKIIERLKLNIEMEYKKKIENFEKTKKELERVLNELYTPVSEPRELIRIVKVGEPSERETRLMFLEAKREINIVSKVFEYYPKVREELISAVKRNVDVKILLLGKSFLSERSKLVQKGIVNMLRKNLDNAEIRFSKTILPLRGVIVDPSYDYTSGKAIFVVEDPKTPLYLRDAAITENPSLVAGMKKYFDLIWKYESKDFQE